MISFEFHCKKVVLTSNCSNSKSNMPTKTNNNFIEECLTTGEKISWFNTNSLISSRFNTSNTIFFLENPLATNNSLTKWFINQFPSVILVQLGYFLLYSSKPELSILTLISFLKWGQLIKLIFNVESISNEIDMGKSNRCLDLSPSSISGQLVIREISSFIHITLNRLWNWATYCLCLRHPIDRYRAVDRFSKIFSTIAFWTHDCGLVQSSPWSSVSSRSSYEWWLLVFSTSNWEL